MENGRLTDFLFRYCQVRRFLPLFKIYIRSLRMMWGVISQITDILKNGPGRGPYAQYGAYCACPSAGLSSGKGMGAVYRCHYPGSKCPGQTRCVSAVGTSCTKQDSHAHKPEAFDIKGAPSKSFVCFQGIFRVQAFQSGQ